MEFKGTKGDWRYSLQHDCITTSKKGIIEGSKIICLVKPFTSFDYSGKEAQFNGLLISKAPEMLEMLKEIANQIEDGRTYVTKDEIEQLIKEATQI